MTPYFLIPGISCIVEWGWNNFDPTSLINLVDQKGLKKLYNNPFPLYNKHILKSKGNYDVIIGIITNFEWSIEGSLIKCKTEISSKGSIYSGLAINTNLVTENIINKNEESNVDPLDNLTQFLTKELSKLKDISIDNTIESISENKPEINNSNLMSTPSPYNEILKMAKKEDKSKPQNITYNKNSISSFVKYVKSKHPSNWEEYIYGVFKGRGPKSYYIDGANKNEDFDYKNKGKDVWFNLGLIIEAVNFHSAPPGFNGKELFSFDIDDVVISGHKNLISSDGTVCLIPNAEAPKYFYGLYGSNPPETTQTNPYNTDYHLALNPSSIIISKFKNKKDATSKNGLADYRLFQICRQNTAIYRDNIDEIINEIRYKNSALAGNHGIDNYFAFPFNSDRLSYDGQNTYPAYTSGYLKNIFVNYKFLLDVLKDKSVNTYLKFIEKILNEINNACGGFWDFKIIDITGKDNLPADSLATLKIVDYKFMASTNFGRVYSFDAFDSDSLILNMNFKPTLSNAQAIRAMYAPVNNPSKNTTIQGDNELLNYQFGDRLLTDDDIKGTDPVYFKDKNGFAYTMRPLQQKFPVENCFQVTHVDVNAKTDYSKPKGDFEGVSMNSVNMNAVKLTAQDILNTKTPSPYNYFTDLAKHQSTNNQSIIIKRLVCPSVEVLKLLLDDGDEENNPKYTGIMPGIQATFTLQGIGGLRTFMMFLVKNYPMPYSHKNIIFRIVDVQEVVESGKWVTTITAGIIPLRKYIKKRLGITY